MNKQVIIKYHDGTESSINVYDASHSQDTHKATISLKTDYEGLRDSTAKQIVSVNIDGILFDSIYAMRINYINDVFAVITLDLLSYQEPMFRYQKDGMYHYTNGKEELPEEAMRTLEVVYE